jgi:hypothetical protein
MLIVSEFRLGDVKVYRKLAAAPQGAILQIRMPNGSDFVGMRCEFAGNAPAALFLPFEDKYLGELLSGDKLPVSLDVTDLVDLHVSVVKPEVPLGEVSDLNGALVMLAQIGGDATTRYVVWLNGPKKGIVESAKSYANLGTTAGGPVPVGSLVLTRKRDESKALS